MDFIENLTVLDNLNNQQIDLFRNVEEKIAKNSGCSTDELKQQFDKHIITNKSNKDGQQLFMLRKLTSQEIVNGTYNNTAEYMIYTPEGECAGYINVIISNKKEANEAEIEYASNEDFRNKGNITIALEEVLKDIFIDKSFDGLQIKPIFPKTEIKEVVLAISEDNYASQAVAKKGGFIKNGGCFEITRDEFIKKISAEKQQELKKHKEFDEEVDNAPSSGYTITPNQIGKKSIYSNIEKKDMAKKNVDRKIAERKRQELTADNHNKNQVGTNDER